MAEFNEIIKSAFSNNKSPININVDTSEITNIIKQALTASNQSPFTINIDTSAITNILKESLSRENESPFAIKIDTAAIATSIQESLQNNTPNIVMQGASVDLSILNNIHDELVKFNSKNSNDNIENKTVNYFSKTDISNANSHITSGNPISSGNIGSIDSYFKDHTDDSTLSVQPLILPANSSDESINSLVKQIRDELIDFKLKLTSTVYPENNNNTIHNSTTSVQSIISSGNPVIPADSDNPPIISGDNEKNGVTLIGMDTGIPKPDKQNPMNTGIAKPDKQNSMNTGIGLFAYMQSLTKNVESMHVVLTKLYNSIDGFNKYQKERNDTVDRNDHNDTDNELSASDFSSILNAKKDSDNELSASDFSSILNASGKKSDSNEDSDSNEGSDISSLLDLKQLRTVFQKLQNLY